MKREFKNQLSKLEKDARLNVWHFALLTSIMLLGIKQKQYKVINVSRKRLMALSHIKTLPSYHKYFKELQELGIIKYTPSYHPGYKSTVELTPQEAYVPLKNLDGVEGFGYR